MPNAMRAKSGSGEHLRVSGTQIGDKFAADVAAYVQQDYRGLYPETWFQNFNASGTAAAVLTTPDISMYGGGMFTISGLTTETVAVTALIDGTVESGAICVRKTDGTFAAASALGNGTYYFDVFFKNLKFTKSAAVQSIVLTGAVKAQKGV